MEEHCLILELKARKETAFKYLVDSYRSRVYNTVLNILQNADEAEDTAQEVFIQVYHAIERFKGDSTLTTWLYRIAVRKALDKLRQHKNRQRLQKIIPWWMPEEEKSGEATFYHPGIVLENKERASQLFRAINSLPENQKIAFTLIKVQGLKYDEASEIMQQSIKAIESLISRAKQNLQQKLSQYKNV